MKGQHKFDRFVERNPHSHKFFFERPFHTRRDFFRLAGAGLSGFFVSSRAARANVGDVVSRGNPQLLNKADNVIFILLPGAPSHTDLFDLKFLDGTTPASFKPETINGIQWPTGILPNLVNTLPDMAVVRSVRSWALQHQLGQAWAQIGRSPAAALGDIAPNVGSIVAVEKHAERKVSDTFPTFLALNANDAIGSGYLTAAYAPVKFVPAQAGFPDTQNPDGQVRFQAKWDLLNALDGALRTNSPVSPEFTDYEGFYRDGRGMMFNPQVDRAFRFTPEEAARYGTSGFGNACLIANKVLAERAGTRYVQINFGGWDHHDDIYDRLPPMAGQLDKGLSTLISDLKSNGLFERTLVVMMGEFGRTVGRLTSQGGRDHFLQQFAVVAGAGVKGGRAIGATDAQGSETTQFGWSRERDIRAEDFLATIYSAIGINYTNIRYDDPFKRGFEYVPYADQDLYGPVNELWSA